MVLGGSRSSRRWQVRHGRRVKCHPHLVQKPRNLVVDTLRPERGRHNCSGLVLDARWKACSPSPSPPVVRSHSSSSDSNPCMLCIERLKKPQWTATQTHRSQVLCRYWTRLNSSRISYFGRLKGVAFGTPARAFLMWSDNTILVRVCQ